jgi:hypothetical protein
MKTSITLLVLFFMALPSVIAGGPAAEFPNAYIDSVQKTSNGWIAVVTGEVKVWARVPSSDEQQFVTLYADKATLRVPVGSQLYALKDQKAYEDRLKSSVGNKELIQIWGAIVTLQAGTVKDITAGDISFLRPRGREAAFDVGRLNDILTK